MKAIRLIFLIPFLSCNLFAQNITPKVIEDDLVKSFKKIEYWNDKYWNDKRESDTTGNALDSLGDAGNIFTDKLIHYTEKYPFTIDEKFNQLSKCLGIESSADGLFRIYTWDTQMGGTKHDFENIIQYRSGPNTHVISYGPEDQSSLACDKLYTLQVGNKKYYLVTNYGVLHLQERSGGISVFAIENGMLNDKVKLIKTKSGLTNKLYFSYYLVDDGDNDAGINYDPNSKTITFPLISENGRVTGKDITYKFTGQYFEKVK